MDTNLILMGVIAAACLMVFVVIGYITYVITEWFNRKIGGTFIGKSVLLQQANGQVEAGDALIQVQNSAGSWSTRSKTGKSGQAISQALDRASQSNSYGVRAVDANTGQLLDIRPGTVIPMMSRTGSTSVGHTSSVINTNRTADVIRRNF